MERYHRTRISDFKPVEGFKTGNNIEPGDSVFPHY